MLTLPDLIQANRDHPSWQRKQEIDALAEFVLPHSPLVNGKAVQLGDDTAAIPDGDGYLLLAAEVIYPPLVAANPYLAGRSAILANVNDVYAMGGRPLALVDTILSPDTAMAAEIVRGLQDGCERYGVAIVGGHTTANSDVTSVAACILGKAKAVLSSFNARPGDRVLHVVNLNGSFHPQFPFWDCSAHLSGEELLRDLDILPSLAEDGLCDAARDISMAGIIGSMLMLLELSGVGAEIDIDAIPQPDAATERYTDWMIGFPSYGFILAARPENVAAIQERFAARDISCADIGTVTADPVVNVRRGDESLPIFDFTKEKFTGFSGEFGK